MRSLAVFARWPEPGRVKTRLSPALPAPLACELHRAMLADTLAAARRARAGRRVIAWADAPDGAGAETGFETTAQHGDDLGARLDASFADLLAVEGSAVIVGSDAPEISGAMLDGAFAALERSDVVLGPTPDGGFFLVGLASHVPGLFDRVPWSTPDARRATAERAIALGRSVTTLDPVADVDTPADLVALLGRLMASPSAAPATAAALVAIGLLPRAG